MKLILKGILFWCTFFEVLLWLSCIESIINTASVLFILTSFICTIVLILACNIFITQKELEKITFYNYFNKK